MANTKITTNVIADDAVTSDKLGGDLTMPGHVSLADNKELRVGTGNDLVIKHDGSHTTLTNTTGNFTLLGDAVYIGNAANNEYLAQFIANGACSLRFNDTEELATVSGGVYIPNKLGIGTNAPGAILSLPAGESNTPRFAIESAVDDNDFTITQYEDSNGTYTMLGQNVKLNSSGNNTVLDSAHRTAGIFLDARSHGAITFITGAANTATEHVKIDSTGKVGIGTTSPNRQLSLKHASQAEVGFKTGSVSNGALIYYNDSEDQLLLRAQESSDSITFQTGGTTERLRIDSTGKVGIGTNAPIMKMHVKGATGDVPSNDSNPPANGIAIFDSGGGYSLVIGTDDSNTGSAWIQSQSANVSSSEYDLLLNPNGGSVGIGTTTNPGGLPLHLKVSSGDNKLRMQTANKDAFVMELRDASGDLWLGTNTTAGAIQIGDAGQVNMPSQPVASYGHTAGSEAGGYSYNFGGTGSVSVICKPQAAIINRGSMYNSSNGRFTAPKAGIYRYAVHGNLYTLYLADGAYFMIQIRKNGGHYVYHYEVNEANSSSWLYNNMGGIISMAKDDYLEFRLVSNNMSGGASGGFGWDASSYTHYEFHLLY